MGQMIGQMNPPQAVQVSPLLDEEEEEDAVKVPNEDHPVKLRNTDGVDPPKKEAREAKDPPKKEAREAKDPPKKEARDPKDKLSLHLHHLITSIAHHAP